MKEDDLPKQFLCQVCSKLLKEGVVAEPYDNSFLMATCAFFLMITTMEGKEFVTDYKDKIKINKILLSMHLVDYKTPAKMPNLVFHRYYKPLTIGYITPHFMVRLYLNDTLAIVFHNYLKRVYSSKENGIPNDLS